MERLSVQEYERRIQSLSVLMERNAHLFRERISEDTWTLYEMVCHLIDSASNNHQRFIRLQLEKNITLPGYDAEIWVNTSGVHDMEAADIISFWKLYNSYLIEVIRSIDTEALRNTGTIDGKELSLQFLVEDYFSHLKWHEDLFRKRVDEITHHLKN